MLALALGRKLVRLQCYEGLDVASAVYEWNYPRQMIEIRLAEAGGDLDRDRACARHLRPALPAEAAAARGAVADRRRGAGAADRRARPHRRAVRGVPARGARRIPGDDPRARRDPRRRAAGRRSSRRTGRARSTTRSSAAASTTGSAIRTRSASSRSSAASARGWRSRWRARSWRSRSGCGRWTCTRRRASPRRSTGPRRWSTLDRVALDPQTIADTAGVLLKYQDDIDALSPEVAARLVDEARAEGTRS